MSAIEDYSVAKTVVVSPYSRADDLLNKHHGQPWKRVVTTHRPTAEEAMTGDNAVWLILPPKRIHESSLYVERKRLRGTA